MLVCLFIYQYFFVLHIQSRVLCYFNALGESLSLSLSLTLCHFSASLSHSQATGSVQCTNTEYNKDINQYRHLCINGSQITVNALVNIQEDGSQKREGRKHRNNAEKGGYGKNKVRSPLCSSMHPCHTYPLISASPSLCSWLFMLKGCSVWVCVERLVTSLHLLPFSLPLLNYP